MYCLCSENKGADQLRGYREADLRLCFRLCGGSFLKMKEVHADCFCTSLPGLHSTSMARWCCSTRSSWHQYLMTLCTTCHTSTVNSTMENHRQWRITRRDIAEFLETQTKYCLLYNLVIYFHICLGSLEV